MRIITGIAKGHKIKTLSGNRIRPTSDRTKETLFNILGDRIVGAAVLDLFAGTGNLGLEALSRGALFVNFVDHSRQSCRLIRENLKLLNFEGDIYCKDVIDFLSSIKSYQLETNAAFDVIFADPPYNQNYIQKVIYHISSRQILNPEGVIVIEHSPTEKLSTDPTDLCIVREKKLGDTQLSFLEIDDPIASL